MTGTAGTSGREQSRLRRSLAVLGGVTALAIIGGSMLSATAANAETAPTSPCATTEVGTTVVEPATTGCTDASDTDSTAAVPTTLDTIKLAKSSMIVYPAAAGFQDTVNFSVAGYTANEDGVAITGTAALTKDAKLVKSWAIDGATTRLTWNGRVGRTVKAGGYTLSVTAWSADGTRRTSSMRVLVSAKHLVTRTVSVRTRDLSRAVTDKLPLSVAEAFRYGPVSLRIHTRAKVHGPANIVITVPGDGSYPVPLLNGKHVTGPIPVQQGFLTAQFSHDWKQRDAKLIDMYTVFTFRQLV